MTWSKLVTVRGLDAFLTPDKDFVAKAHVGGKHDGPGVILDPGGADIVAKSHDFVDGDTGDFTYLSGDTGQSSGLAAVTNGVFRLFNTPSTTPTQTSAGNEEINGSTLQWKADQGPGNSGRLHIGARVKLSSVSRTANRGHVFIGFKDTAAIEHPAYDTGGDAITASSDLVGFMFSPGGDTGWVAIGKGSVSGDTGHQLKVVDTGPEAGVYDFLEMILTHGPGDTGGTAHFFVNGRPAATLDSPVASTTAMTWVASAWQQDTGSAPVDIDLINVSALRDTGT